MVFASVLPDGNWPSLRYTQTENCGTVQSRGLTFAARHLLQAPNLVNESSHENSGSAAAGWFGHVSGTANQLIAFGQLTQFTGHNVTLTGASNSVDRRAVALDVAITAAHLRGVGGEHTLSRRSVTEEISAFFSLRYCTK